MRQLDKIKGNIVEQMFRNKEGELVRATFCVYESNGRIKARVLNFEYIEEYNETRSSVYLLEQNATLRNNLVDLVEYSEIISPYYSARFIYLFGSKPRAPSHR